MGPDYNEIERSSGKKVIHAESLDVPFILRYPLGVAPMVVDDVFTSVDIMPNLVDDPDYQGVKDALYADLLAWLDYVEYELA